MFIVLVKWKRRWSTLGRGRDSQKTNIWSHWSPQLFIKNASTKQDNGYFTYISSLLHVAGCNGTRRRSHSELLELQGFHDNMWSSIVRPFLFSLYMFPLVISYAGGGGGVTLHADDCEAWPTLNQFLEKEYFCCYFLSCTHTQAWNTHTCTNKTVIV